MPTRILRDWTDSETIGALSVDAERFFLRLIMKADDFGRFAADSRLLRANLFPLLVDSISEAMVRAWLADCINVGLIETYEVNRKKYLQIVKFGQRLRAKRSKFPPPSADDCPQSAAECRNEPPEARGERRESRGASREAESDLDTPKPPRGLARGKATDDAFERFWDAWPSHKRKGGRKRCGDWWKTRKPDAAAVMVCLARWKTSVKWSDDDGEYVPAPLTWLRGELWTEKPLQVEGTGPDRNPTAEDINEIYGGDDVAAG